METSGVELRLAERVVHRDAGTGDDEPGAVAHAGGYGDGVALRVHAREMGGVRGAKRVAEDLFSLGDSVFFAGEPFGYTGVVITVQVSGLPVGESVLHGSGHRG